MYRVGMSRGVVVIASLAALVVLASALRLASGPGGLAWPESGLVLELRAIRLLAALSIGASLAVAGVLLQATLRNPLASPYLLGLTSGASLGVVVATYIAYVVTGSVVRHDQPMLPALVGALSAFALVYWLGRRRGEIEPISLILIGVVVTVVFGALSMFFQSLLSSAGLETTARWLMGSISDDIRWPRLWLVCMICVAGTGIGATLGPALDAASMSDDEARSVGVRLARLRLISFVTAGVLTGSTVVLAGPIGFVGLICPHLVRLLSGPRHRSLAIGSALAGAALLALADSGVALVRTDSGRIPIGVITALVGGPVFVVLLRRGRGAL